MTDLTIHTTIDIHASAAAAWRLFGEGFGDWAAWAPGIDKSTLEGPLAQGVFRTNEAPSLGTVRQELVRYEPAARALAYEMREGLPPFLTGLRNDWVIEELADGRSRLTGEALFRLTEQAAPMAPKLEAQMGGVLQGFAAAFRAAMEGEATAEA